MLLFYMKYLPGNIYSNTFSACITNIIAQLSAGAIYKKFGLKKTFTGLFCMSITGAFVIIFLGTDNTFWMPFFVVLTVFGFGGGFVLVYVATFAVFPVLFASTASGFCNFFGRLLTVAGPIVAEMDPPLPIIFVVCLLCVGLILI
mgnify:CR=1 FL=1|jgi:MFS family permease